MPNTHGIHSLPMAPLYMCVNPKIGVGPNPPKASHLFIGFGTIIIINHHPFWGVKSPYFWVDTHICISFPEEINLGCPMLVGLKNPYKHPVVSMVETFLFDETSSKQSLASSFCTTNSKVKTTMSFYPWLNTTK